MADTVPPSVKKANFFRLSSLLIDGGKVALKSVFDDHVPPGNLQTHIHEWNHMHTLKTLKRYKHLKQSQEDLLFPSSTDPPVCSSTFDITLLIMLLRNICGLNTTFNWGVVPESMDHTEEADIVRIRNFRNTVQHTSRMSIEADDFENLWTEIKNVLLRVERNVPNFEEEINKLKTDSIDPQKEDYYKTVFREWEEKDKEMQEDIDELTTRMDATEEQLQSHNERLEEIDRQDNQTDDMFSRLNERQEVRHNEVKALIDAVQQEARDRVDPALEKLQSRSEMFLEHFKSNRQAFVETRAYHDAKVIFDKSGLLVLIGNPGEGASTIAVNLMLDRAPTERCLILEDPGDWKEVNWKSNKCDVILIDLHQGFLSEWSSKLVTLSRIAQKGNVRFILTTQLYILEESKSDLSDFDMFTSEEHIVHVRTADLSDDEMEKILSNLLELHKKETNTLLVRNCVSNHRGFSGLCTREQSIGFPKCAALFSTYKRLYEKGDTFFKSPKKFWHTCWYKKIKQRMPVMQEADEKFANTTKINKAMMSAFKEDITEAVISDFDDAELFDNYESVAFDFDVHDFHDLPDFDFPDHDSVEDDFHDLPDNDFHDSPDNDLPDHDSPDNDFHDSPDNDLPDTPDHDSPDNDFHDSPDNDFPGTPDHDSPDNDFHDTPDHDSPDNDFPDTPDHDSPDNDFPDTPDHDSPDNDFHDSPDNDFHDSPDNDFHDSPDNDFHDSPDNDFHDSPDNDVHDSPDNDVHDSPENDFQD